MTGRSPRGGGPVAWLTAQAILFGASAALLGVVANAMFLGAFGSGWLPATYIVIGLAGIAVSAGIRRGAARFDLARLAVAVLGGAAGLFFLAWLVAVRGDGSWVSAPLLVLFPILIQLGFVFVGGQAGRVLDIAGIKASFPRIMAGFPVGATIGGLAAVPLVDVFGHVEDLLFATAIVEAAFAGLVWATGRRFAPQLAPRPETGSSGADEPPQDRAQLSLRHLLGRPFVALVLGYQVLSALGSQIADFLVFDRASALYPGAEDLGRFVAAYTAVMNGVAIAFLFLVAGPLLRRYGLRLGIGANPIADLALAVGILAALVVAGPASFVLLGMVSAARIADIALTDGLTRTSINALYQVLPARQRLVAQATVEGMGVPIAIGASGVLILVLEAFPAALAARIVVLALVCTAWAWVAGRLYREYGPALGAALQTRRLLEIDAPLDASLEDVVTLGTLAAGTDARGTRLARELVALIPSGTSTAGVMLGSRTPPAPAMALEGAGVASLRDALQAARDGTAARSDPLGDGAPPPELLVARLLRASPARSPQLAAVLRANLDHPDRAIGLVVMERLAGSRPDPDVDPEVLERGREADLESARYVLGAIVALSNEPALDDDGAVARALSDELALLARRLVARMHVRFGRDELGPALSRLARDPGTAALAAESLEVTLGRLAAADIVALLAPGLEPAERLHAVSARAAPAVARTAREWLLDIAEDGRSVWRSPWLRACAIRAVRRHRLVDGSPVRITNRHADPVMAEELGLLEGAAPAG